VSLSPSTHAADFEGRGAVWRTGILAILAALGCVLLVLVRPDRLPLASAVFSAATIGVGLLPGIDFIGRRSSQPFPFFPAVGAFYAVFFGLPPFLIDIFWPRDQPLQAYLRVSSLGPEVTGLAFAGTALMIVGFFMSRSLVWQRLPVFRLPSPLHPGRVRLLLWGLMAGHFLWMLVPGVQRLPSAGQFLQPAGYLAFGAFLLMAWRGELSRWEGALVFGALLPAKLVLAVAATLLSSVLFLLAFLIMMLHQVARRWFWAGIAGLVGLTAVAFVPLHLVRDTETWTKLGPIGRVQHVGQLIGEQFSEQRTFPTAPPLLPPIVKRIAQVVVLGAVVELTPSEIPYWGGETYKPLLTSFVPRALWPNKPEERTGNAFGMRYGLLLPVETQMSVNLPWLTELYANFGRAGLVLGMLIIGVFLALLDRLFNAKRMNYLEASVGLTVLFPLILQESNFSVLTGSLLPLALCLWLYFRVGLTLQPGPWIRKVLRPG